MSCIEGGENTCEHAAHCVTVEVWKKIDEAVSGVVDRITLTDLVQWSCEKAAGKE